MNIELHEFQLAAERIAPIIHRTELEHSATFSAMTGGEIFLKCENRQKTGAFKLRGASNKIASMVARGERCPVVASSAGNHAQGVAYAAKMFSIPATIVMPEAAPIAKVQATEGYGARQHPHRRARQAQPRTQPQRDDRARRVRGRGARARGEPAGRAARTGLHGARAVSITY